MDIDQIRRDNIRALEEKIGPDIYKRAKMSPAQFYNLRDGAKDSRTGKPRGMRKETAWKIEDAAGVPRGYLDIRHDVEAMSAPVGLEAALETVAEAVKHLTPTSRELAKVLLSHLADGGDTETVRALLSVLKAGEESKKVGANSTLQA